MQQLSINQYEDYIHDEYLSHNKYDVVARIYPDQIQGIPYSGILYKEVCSNNKISFVTMPVVSPDELCIGDRIICSNTTSSRLCTIIMAYHVFGKDCVSPVIAYLLAKTMTMKNGYEFEISSLLPSKELERLSSRISNEDGKPTDIVSSAKTVFMDAIVSKKIPWLEKSKRFKIGFAISTTEDWMKKVDNENRI